MRKIVCTAFLACLVAPCLGQSLAQSNQYEHQLFRPGHENMTVFIWGAVGAPGIWRVEPQVDLVELLSAARLQGVGSEPSGRRQTTYVRIYRNGTQGRNMIYETTVEALLDEPTSYPSLQAGDVVTVETVTRSRISVRTISSLVGTASTLVLLYLRLRDARN